MTREKKEQSGGKLFFQADIDTAVLDLEGLDSGWESAGEGGEEGFTLKVAEPGVREGDAVGGEVIEDEAFFGDEEAGAGAEGVASEDGEIGREDGADAGVEGIGD